MKRFIIALIVMVLFCAICGLLLGLIMSLLGLPQWTIVFALIGGYFSSILFEKIMSWKI